PARVRIERGHRLVEQEHLRPASERARERDALALTAGPLGRLRLGEVLDMQPPQQPVRARTAEGDVLLHIEVRKERVLLKHETDRTLLRSTIDAPVGV